MEYKKRGETNQQRDVRLAKERDTVQDGDNEEIRFCLTHPLSRAYLVKLVNRSGGFDDAFAPNNNQTFVNLGARQVVDRILKDMNQVEGELSRRFNEEINAYRYRTKPGAN